MSPVWHLVKKDLRRLRVPLALFSLLVAGKIIFFAVIAGLFSTPDIEWLRRLQNVPEILLRFLAEPIFAYLLVGWLVFDDSPVEPDAHWLTRPISGGQMFGAKLAAAGLMFILWPLVLNVLWWLACGVSSRELLVSAGERVGLYTALVTLGLACAALTDGFPRFVLWSIVGVLVFAMAQLGFTIVGAAGFGPERFVVCAVGCSLGALGVAAHQFVTRRHRTSLMLVGAGGLVVAVVCSAWQWNIPRPGENPARAATAESARISLHLTGPARYHRFGARQYAQLPLQIDGVPDRAVVERLNLAGEWSFGGARVWTSRTKTGRSSLLHEAIRRQLGFAAKGEPDGRMLVDLPFSLALAERAAREPAAFQARGELELGVGKILAELPLREGRSGAYAVSHVGSGPVPETGHGKAAAAKPEPRQNGVSLLLTEKSAQGFKENSSVRMVATNCVLVNRRTGEFFLSDPVRSGPEALAVMNQAMVACWRLTFLVGEAPLHPDDLTLVVIRFSGSELVKCDLSAAALSFAADSLPESTPPPVGPDIARMDELVRAHAAGDRFMGSVLVAKGDATLFAQSAGWAEVDRKVPNTADTRFRIGSLTKQFTAAAILLLEERGRLKVDDPLSRFVPDLPEAWRGVTLRQLLTHTSGIPNFTNFPEYAAWKREPQTPAQLLARLRDRPLDFAPGEKFKYSNSGYVLLGWVVELASGQDYGTFLRDNLFLPLGMKDSGYEADAPAGPSRARGYVPGLTGPVGADDIDMHVPGGAGGLYSTAPDLLRWTQGLFGGKLLTPAALQEMTTPGKGGYAFGLGVNTVDGRRIIAHAGAIDGFVSQLTYFPEDKMTVVVLANTSGAPVAELAGQLAEVAFGKTVTLPAERKEVAVPVAVLQRYTGVYQLSSLVTNTVRLVDGRLTTQLSGQRGFPLFPESDRKFFLKAVDARVEFVTDDQGRVTHLLQFQGGRTQQAGRIGDVPAERQAVPVSPAILATFAGSYELRPDFVITVTLEGAQLMIAAPGQGKSPLLAESETKYFSPVVDAQVEFFRDNHDAVTHLIVQSGGREQRATRKP